MPITKNKNYLILLLLVGNYVVLFITVPLEEPLYVHESFWIKLIFVNNFIFNSKIKNT